MGNNSNEKYVKLIDSLRYCAKNGGLLDMCQKCEWHNTKDWECNEVLMQTAAEAIEELIEHIK